MFLAMLDGVLLEQLATPDEDPAANVIRPALRAWFDRIPGVRVHPAPLAAGSASRHVGGVAAAEQRRHGIGRRLEGHPTAKAQGKPSGDLTISNWALYIDKKTIPDFEQATGINVHYIEDINSYDEFFGKMQPLLPQGQSGGRSLMVATDWLAKDVRPRLHPAARQEGARAGVQHLNPDDQGSRIPTRSSPFPGRAG